MFLGEKTRNVPLIRARLAQAIGHTSGGYVEEWSKLLARWPDHMLMELDEEYVRYQVLGRNGKLGRKYYAPWSLPAEEAWEAMETQGLLTSGFSNDEHRFFRDPWGVERRTPFTVAECVLIASDVHGVMAAEQIGREVASAAGHRSLRIVWRYIYVTTQPRSRRIDFIGDETVDLEKYAEPMREIGYSMDGITKEYGIELAMLGV